MQDTGCKMQTRCAGFSKTGTRYRVPDSVSGLRPSAWTKGEGRSYLPRPSSLHGRGPDTEDRAGGPAIWHLGPGTRHRSRSDAEDRTPSTEDRARPLKNAPTGFASCIPRVRVFRRQVPGTGFQVPGTWHLGPGTRYRINAEGRTPSTEDRAKRAHRVCIMHPASIS